MAASVNYAIIGKTEQSTDPEGQEMTYAAIGGLDLRRASQVEAPSQAAGGDVMYASIAKGPPPPGRDYEVEEDQLWRRSLSDAAGRGPVSQTQHATMHVPTPNVDRLITSNINDAQLAY